MSWHPKVTPYRLALLATTIVLGTAKAIVTQRRGSLTSTTLEWVGGTLLSIIFFSFSAYDSGQRIPMWLHWVFKPDCMNVLWNALGYLFHFRRPEYSSHEMSSSDIPLTAHPSITPYRVLVTATITFFGTYKAVLGYTGQSASLTWIDWAIGTPITCIIYVLGLYENNPGRMWVRFYTADQSEILKEASIDIFLVIISAAWIAVNFQALRLSASLDLGSSHPTTNTSIWTRVGFSNLLPSAVILVTQELLIGAIGLGLLPIYSVVNTSVVNSRVSQRHLERISNAIQTPISAAFGRLIHQGIHRLLHVVFYLYITSVLLTGCALCLGVLVDTFTEPQSVLTFILESFAICMVFTFFAMAISAVRSMVRNFPT